MTEQQQHLKQAIAQQKTLIEEINQSNNVLALKKEQATKLQGIIEYLIGNGVAVPEELEDDQPTEVLDT